MAKMPTKEEWLQEIQRLDAGPDGFTAAELATKQGWSRSYAQCKIKAGVAFGALRFAGKRRTQTITGAAAIVPVYQVVQ